MKNILKNTIIVAVAVAGLAAATAFAQISALGVGVNASTSASGTVSIGARRAAALASRITTATTRADEEITRRVNALDALSARVNAMVKISSTDKANLSSTIQAQITAMNTLNTQIAADAAADSTSSLKTDIQSITKSYRIFALVIPQGAIEAAADRVLTVASDMTTLAGNLQTRITAAQSAGNDMSVSVSALADLNAKVADANAQANAATAEVASLQPDNGVQTVMASNTAALKDARSKIQTAQQDLIAARKDAGTIVSALIALKGSAAASGTVSASGTAQ